MTPRLHDQDARERIANDLDTTYLVEAAAGTGKTTALIARMISVIRTGRGQLSRMTALTFTEKAAGEMKLRLQTALDECRQRSELDPSERTRIDQAMAELELAKICTIHAFCHDLLRENPVAAGIDPEFEVASENQARRYLDSAFDSFFEEVLRAPPQGLRRFLGHRRWSQNGGVRETLTSACNQLAGQRDYQGRWSRPQYDRDGEVDELVRSAAALAGLAERGQAKDPLRIGLAPMVDFIARLRERERVLPRDYDLVESQLVALNRAIDWRKRGRSNRFADNLLRADVILQRDDFHARLGDFLGQVDADIAALLQRELHPVLARYEREKSTHGLLDFLDLLVKVRDLLRDDADIRTRQQARYDHIFVDEFQDTDPLQTEILFLLAADDPSSNTPWDARLIPGKVFFVGDPKQSIYRFRRADIGLYEQVKTKLLTDGAQVLYLDTNFRTVENIQRAINIGFSQAMPAASSQTQARYVPLHPHRSSNTKQPSVVALSIPAPFGWLGKVTKTAVNKSTPEAVGGFVAWLLGDSGWTVEDPTTGHTVPIRAEHICLLFRKFVSFQNDVTRGYARQLEARGISHVLVGGRSYHEREEILAMTAVLRAIEWPDDELNVYATLRGPFVALQDDQLFLYRQQRGRLHPLRPIEAATTSRPDATDAAENNVDTEQVDQALALLGALHRRRNRRPIAETITEFLETTRAFAGVAIWPAGEQALANLLHILEIARRFEAEGATSFRSFVDYFDREAKRRDGIPAPLLERDVGGVQIMTVHSAKGLEFPVVIVCDPGGSRLNRRPSRYIDRERGLWAASLAGYAPLELVEQADDVIAADDAEEVRIAYVAATRARDLLVLPAVGEGTVSGWGDLLHPAIYPADRRAARPAHGCPAFGDDSVRSRGPNVPMESDGSIKPGWHHVDGVDVVWWDPHCLVLEADARGGVRQQELLAQDDINARHEQELTRYRNWKTRRERTLAQASHTEHQVMTVTQASTKQLVDTPAFAITTEVVPGVRDQRPRGPRFGTLVHAALADTNWQCERVEIATLVDYHGNNIGATAPEKTAATDVVLASLQFPLLLRAADAARSRRCFRELPLVLTTEAGHFIDGVADLVFRDDDTWTIVDYKTDAPGNQDAPSQRYRSQVSMYCAAIHRTYGEMVRGIVLYL